MLEPHVVPMESWVPRRAHDNPLKTLEKGAISGMMTQ
jgi:hypothetical protein